MSTSRNTQSDTRDLTEIAILRQAIARHADGNATARALIDILEEQARAIGKFPMQHIPDGTPPMTEYLGHDQARIQAEQTRDMIRWGCQRASASGELTWRHVLLEEVYEAMAERRPEALRDELVQVANVALRWVKDIDRRTAIGPPAAGTELAVHSFGPIADTADPGRYRCDWTDNWGTPCTLPAAGHQGQETPSPRQVARAQQLARDALNALPTRHDQAWDPDVHEARAAELARLARWDGR